MAIVYTNSITAEDANAIRASVGFKHIHPEQLAASLEGSTLVVAAYDGGHAVGMARLITDGGSVALIHDMLVVPEYRGIERELVTRILDFLRAKLKPGFGIQVDVRAWGGQIEMYEELGFRVSTTAQRGTPMQNCLVDRIELTDEMFAQNKIKRNDE